ncbi:class I SAM-dependent methyltransferase [Candidatus Pelagibacter ubique]|jgi:hypothetical protein|nr:class I SAM-dependent methyltransferase [Candidatus Pelagibacter ubique]
MNKFKYLIETRSSLRLFKEFLRYYFLFPFIKRKRKNFINDYRNFYNKKKYTLDFFSQNTFDWINVLERFKRKDFDYLEIGSFEGNSALFILNYFQTNSVHCVDPWIQLYKEKGSNEGYEDISIIDVEKNFDYNLKNYDGRFKKYKMKSDVFFKENINMFDVIYVDGSHFADDVLKDCRSSWACLKKNGILILDDFFWKNYKEIENNPAHVINLFLKEINNCYKILRLSKFQLFIEKTK